MTKQPDITAEIMLFSQQFNTLISAGCSLVKILKILEKEAPPTYANVMPTIRIRIEQGDSLAQAIADMPDLFPSFYRLMITAGEVGGILDITMNYAAELIEEDWKLSKLLNIQPLLMATENDAADWNQLSKPQRTLKLLLFCRMLGSMLSSGVPIVHTMKVAAESLNEKQRNEVLSAVEVMLNRGSIEEIVAKMTFLPFSAQTLFTLGSDTGQLDSLLLKAAELYRHELVYQQQQ
ncbi:MAG: type II secretion system F family protein [bacterium]